MVFTALWRPPLIACRKGNDEQRTERPKVWTASAQQCEAVNLDKQYKAETAKVSRRLSVMKHMTIVMLSELIYGGTVIRYSLCQKC